MPDVNIDPAQPLEIEATFDTPLRVTVEFLYRKPRDASWTSFFTARVGEDVPNQVVHCNLDPLPRKSVLLLTSVYAGAKGAAFRSAMVVSQTGNPLAAPFRVSGTTGAKFAAYREVEVTLR